MTAGFFPVPTDGGSCSWEQKWDEGDKMEAGELLAPSTRFSKQDDSALKQIREEAYIVTDKSDV